MNDPIALKHAGTAAVEAGGKLYVPPLELTKGQPAPVAANGGLSYASFDRGGDAGTGAATAAALKQVAEGKGRDISCMLEAAPPGPIKTQWGIGFREYGECVAKEEKDNRNRALYFPQVLRDARRIGEYYPGLRADSPECMDKLGVSLAHLESECQNFYDAHEVERVFYPEMEKLLLDFFPGATDALVYNHDVFDKQYKGDRTEDQDNKNPGVNENYVNMVHNDLNDNSGRVRVRELLLNNLRNFGREQHYTEAEADAKMSRRFMSINLAKPMETVQQWPFVLCAWPSFADQSYITNYRVYDDRVGETTRFTHRADHEWYWFPQQTSTEVSMLKCYDSVTDGSVSRWSFHSACYDWTAPEGAPFRKNVVVRAFVFF